MAKKKTETADLRKLHTLRFTEKFKTVLRKVSKAEGISQSKLLEVAFWMFRDQVSRMNADQKAKLVAEAKLYIEQIERNSKE